MIQWLALLLLSLGLIKRHSRLPWAATFLQWLLPYVPA
jgi:hypothetical protein